MVYFDSAYRFLVSASNPPTTPINLERGSTSPANQGVMLQRTSKRAMPTQHSTHLHIYVNKNRKSSLQNGSGNNWKGVPAVLSGMVTRSRSAAATAAAAAMATPVVYEKETPLLQPVQQVEGVEHMERQWHGSESTGTDAEEEHKEGKRTEREDTINLPPHHKKRATALKTQRKSSPIRPPPPPRTHLSSLRTLNHGKGLPTSAAERMKWTGADGKRLQAKYDSAPYAKHIPRAVKSIWKAAVQVRRQLQSQGVNQTPLCRGKSALTQAEGIIYAIVARGQSNIYVGQTFYSALKRFGGHVNHARTEQDTPLHTHIQKEGIRHIHLIPLELIPVNRYRNAKGVRCSTMFRTVASVRERYWIERLHSYIPRGSNVEWSARKRHRKRHKPMKWAIEKRKKDQNMNPELQQLQSIDSESKLPGESINLELEIQSIDELQLAASEVQSYSSPMSISSSDPHRLSNSPSHLNLSSSLPAAAASLSDSESGSESVSCSNSIATADSISLLASDHSFASTKSRGKVGIGTDDTYSYRPFGYRNWLRRCRFLIELHDTNKSRLERHAAISFHRYAARNLWKMINFLEKEESHGFPSEAAMAVAALIRQHLLVRNRDYPTAKRVGSSTISVEWTSQLLRKVPLRRIMMSEASRSLFPSAADQKLLTDVSVVRRLVEPFGRALYNYGKVARNLPNESTDLSDCPCRGQFAEQFRPDGECVHTGDLAIVESQALRSLMLMGSKLRVYTTSDPLDAIRAALDGYINKISGSTAVTKQAFTGWRMCIIAACEKYLLNNVQHSSPRIVGQPSQRNRSTTCGSRSVSVVTLQPADRKYLRFLQHHLVLVPVDKAANNVAVVCKRLYTQILFQELNSSNEDATQKQLPAAITDDTLSVNERSLDHDLPGSIAPVSDSVVAAVAYANLKPTRVYGTVKSRTKESIISEHVATMSRTYALKDTPTCLAYLYWTPKLHKNPASQRFIAAAFACTSTEFSRILSDCLTSIMHKLREKDDDHIRRTGIRRYFIVDGYEEVAAFLNKWPRRSASASSQRLQTGDFSTMYTTIPHEDLLVRVRQVVNEAWEWEANQRRVDAANIALVWKAEDGGTCKWFTSRARENPPQHTAKAQKLTMEVFHKMVKWPIDNIYLVNGDICRRQEIGIPMGTNCAPALANLYLYSYEAAYIDKLRANGEKDTARAFHMTFRLIDDVLSVDNPHFQQAVAGPYESNGMYPAALALNDTSISSEEVHFLGMTIRTNQVDGKLILDVFDKRREFPFAVCRYPHKQSLLPSFIAYGVFVGLIHRYYRICTVFSDFCFNASLLANTLITQGWQRHRLRSHFRNFLTTRISLKWTMTIKQCCAAFTKLIQSGVADAILSELESSHEV